MASAFFGFRRDLEKIAPVEAAGHDDYHHSRGGKSSRQPGRFGARKHRHHRATKNEMAFQSRKRNRAA